MVPGHSLSLSCRHGYLGSQAVFGLLYLAVFVWNLCATRGPRLLRLLALSRAAFGVGFHALLVGAHPALPAHARARARAQCADECAQHVCVCVCQAGVCVSPWLSNEVHTVFGNAPLAPVAFLHFSIQGQISASIALQFICKSTDRWRLAKLALVNMLALFNISALVWWWLGQTDVEMQVLINVVHLSVVLLALYESHSCGHSTRMRAKCASHACARACARPVT